MIAGFAILVFIGLILGVSDPIKKADAIVLLSGGGKVRKYLDFVGFGLGFNIVKGAHFTALYPIVGLFVFFHNYVPVPGAMDNLAGIAVLNGLVKYLREAQARDEFFPEHTEILVVAMGAEEAGLRGAKRYVQRHLAELKDGATSAIIVDNICDERFLTVVARELCTGARHDPGLVLLATEAAAENEFLMSRSMVPLGATDAAAFSLEGIPAVTILSQDISQLTENYHTRHDTPEHVRPESLAAVLQVTLTMIEKLDRRVRES